MGYLRVLELGAPGYGDQRGLELPVEAGFSAVEAIQIVTLNKDGVGYDPANPKRCFEGLMGLR
jgi:hypothetical protein